jgi:hypothetical protein
MADIATLRGDASLRRPFDEAAEHARWVDDSFRAMLAAERTVTWCRAFNGLLADISACRGLRWVFAQANLRSHVGQVRLAKYLAAYQVWREQPPGRPEWFATMDMAKTGKHLASWLGIDPKHIQGT